MKKLPYNNFRIEIITDQLDGDIVQFFSNGNENTKTYGFVYICDSARYPKRVAKKIGEFKSNGTTYIKNLNYIFEEGIWIVYLNFKGNFYIFKRN